MAENKKTKANWKDALASEASKLVPARPEQSQETIVYMRGGKPQKLVRGDMSDAEWQAVVDLVMQGQEPDKAAEAVVSRDSYGPGTIYPDKATYERTKAMSPEDRKLENQRLAEIDSEKNAPPRPGARSGDTFVMQLKNGDKMTITRQDQTDEEWAQTIAKQQQLYKGESAGDMTSPKLGTKPLEPKYDKPGLGGPGMSVRGQMMNLVQGATPGAQLKDGTVDNYSGAADEAGQIADAVGNEASKVGGELVAAPAKVGAGLEKAAGAVADIPGQVAASPVGNFVSNVAQTGADIGSGVLGAMQLAKPATDVSGLANAAANSQFVKTMSTPNMSPRERSDEEQKAKMDPGAGYDPATMPATQHPNPTLPQPPQAPTGSGSASLDLTMMPQVAAPQVGYKPTDMTQFRKAVDEAKARYDHATKTMEDTANKQDELAVANEKKRLEYQQYADEQTKAAAQFKMESVAKAEKYQAARQAVLERAREAASDPIDPNRFWNNKNDGQKAAAIIAGALFGFTGQGMNWLQRIDGLVESDNRLQAADRASRVAGLQSEAAGLGELGQDALRNGASLAEAKLLEKQGKYEGLQLYLQGMAEKSQNLERRARYAEMAAQMGERRATLEHQVVTLQQADEAHRSQIAAKDAEMRLAAMKMRADMFVKMAAGGRDGQQEMKPAQQERLAQMRAVAGNIANMWADYNRLATSVIPGKPGAASVFPENMSDSARWNGSKATQYTQIIGKPLEGGVVREEDTKRYRQAYIPNATDTESLAREKVQTLVDYAANQYASEYNTMKSAGVVMGDNLTPEQFKQMIQQRTFGGRSGAATTQNGVSFTPSK